VKQCDGHGMIYLFAPPNLVMRMVGDPNAAGSAGGGGGAPTGRPVDIAPKPVENRDLAVTGMMLQI
jgi:hypothetical protein